MKNKKFSYLSLGILSIASVCPVIASSSCSCNSKQDTKSYYVLGGTINILLKDGAFIDEKEWLLKDKDGNIIPNVTYSIDNDNLKNVVQLKLGSNGGV